MKVVITDYQYENIDSERSIITGAGYELFDYQVKTTPDLIPVVKDADAVITQYSDINAEVIEHMQNCKIIIKYGIGVNNIDCEAASRKGIYVCNVPDYGVDEVSDHACTMLLAFLTQGVCVSAAQFDDGASAFSDGTGSVSALASTLAKQTEEQTQEFVAKEEEAAQIREERRVEKAEKASEKAEQEKTAVLESIQQTVEDTKKKIAEEAEAKRLAKRQEVVNFALQFEGNPYVYGGTSLTNGADCSGFVMSVFANFGYSLPRVAAAQCDASTKKDISQLEPGDLVFYGSGYIDHVALYIGDGKIIHASNAATGIKISDYDYEQPAAVGTFME